MTDPLRSETDDRVRVITLTRPDEYNTINPELRDDAGRRARRGGRATAAVHVGAAPRRGSGVLRGLPARLVDRGQAQPTWCASACGIRWPTLQMIGRFAATCAKLHTISQADDRGRARLVHRGRYQHRSQRRPDRLRRNRRGSGIRRCVCGAYPRRRGCGSRASASSGPSGTCSPATRSPARRRPGSGSCSSALPSEQLDAHARALAHRMAPACRSSQLQMLKLGAQRHRRARCTRPTRHACSACLFDGVARHTQEGLDFVARSVDVGFRQAVRERDDPFGDYGSRPRT